MAEPNPRLPGGWSPSRRTSSREARRTRRTALYTFRRARLIARHEHPLDARTREMLLIRWELMVGPKDAKRRCGDLRFVFPGNGKSGHLVTVQNAHGKACIDAGLEAFEFYCWRHTFGTRCAESGMDKFALAQLMGHSSPRVAERYYIHVTEPHVMTGFEKFAAYQSSGMINAVKQVTASVQWAKSCSLVVCGGKSTTSRCRLLNSSRCRLLN